MDSPQREYVIAEVQKMTQKVGKVNELLTKERDILLEQIRVCKAMEKQRKEWKHV